MVSCLQAALPSPPFSKACSLSSRHCVCRGACGQEVFPQSKRYCSMLGLPSVLLCWEHSRACVCVRELTTRSIKRLLEGGISCAFAHFHLLAIPGIFDSILSPSPGDLPLFHWKLVPPGDFVYCIIRVRALNQWHCSLSVSSHFIHFFHFLMLLHF